MASFDTFPTRIFVWLLGDRLVLLPSWHWLCYAEGPEAVTQPTADLMSDFKQYAEVLLNYGHDKLSDPSEAAFIFGR